MLELLPQEIFDLIISRRQWYIISAVCRSWRELVLAKVKRLPPAAQVRCQMRKVNAQYLKYALEMLHFVQDVRRSPANCLCTEWQIRTAAQSWWRSMNRFSDEVIGCKMPPEMASIIVETMRPMAGRRRCDDSVFIAVIIWDELAANFRWHNCVITILSEVMNKIRINIMRGSRAAPVSNCMLAGLGKWMSTMDCLIYMMNVDIKMEQMIDFLDWLAENNGRPARDLVLMLLLSSVVIIRMTPGGKNRLRGHIEDVQMAGLRRYALGRL